LDGDDAVVVEPDVAEDEAEELALGGRVGLAGPEGREVFEHLACLVEAGERFGCERGQLGLAAASPIRSSVTRLFWQIELQVSKSCDARITDRLTARLRDSQLALPYAEAMDAGREFDVVMVAEPEGGYSVFVPDLPSVATQGDTIEEARANAQEVIEGYLEVMHEDDLPIPSVHRDRVAVHAV
jgi:predicted RNase H-like HicB family nuclease